MVYLKTPPNYCKTTTYSHMLHHLKLHGNQAAVFCEICLSTFKSLSGFLKHSKKCSKNQNNICTIENEIENKVVNQVGITKINEDYLGALALHLQGKYRCAQNVLNIIFSNLKVMLSVFNIDIEALKATCDKLSTQYLREKYYKNNLQAPTPKVIGLNKQGCIIPFIEMLSFLLQSQEINDFTAVNKNTNHMKIGIYCDNLGITNPLGKARKKQKMFVFYFQILNIPSLYCGRMSTIFPLIFTLTKWVKDKNFYSILFSDFISSISQLENGIVIKVMGISKKITAEVVYFSGDSLSANAIGGFKEGFSAKTFRCCRSCNSTRQQMKDFSNHEECNIRNAAEHMTRVTELNSGLSKPDKLKWSKYYGIVSKSILSNIPGFDVTKQLLFDPMHDLLEGLIPLQLELFLSYAIQNNFFTLQEINDWLQGFSYANGIEKPNMIHSSIQIHGCFSSGQTLTLSCVISFFILEHMDQADAHFMCLSKLIQVLQLCLSPIVTPLFLSDLKALIQDHHRLFLCLYPNKFIPKLHFLIHYPAQAKQFGALREHMCMANERKHQVVKNFRHFNFKNIPYSACKTMIINTASNFFNGKRRGDVYGQVDELKFKKGSIISVKVNGIIYKIGDIISCLHEEKLIFYKIFSISSENDKRAFKFSKLMVQGHSAYLICYESSEQVVIYPDTLIFPWCTIQYSNSSSSVNGKINIFPLAVPNLNFF
ncbi:uncharacterized protein LOC124808579 isoform X1 [Hydra vulgaris]|uniref:uncharacterized protein LOC124808579 isoform X1 n=1 Tax=Hydra vulgaris TaxID=6087 RepID=UPI0032EA3242